ncbi:kinase-like protein [Artomyces pyxidatus]|uniref:Kinase-like protein n=1 Tax=Artomyces pyxidatus TaxID=48021 RepID=A0ACB8SJN6_9AGAM|nr:kinase-like protein [Artomyces pyxidatus]
MAPAIVLARLSPDIAPSHYYSLENPPPFPPTQPCLALRLERTDLLSRDCGPLESAKRCLFVISTEKPSGDYEGCYFPLVPTEHKEKMILTVEPPFPRCSGPLYVHTSPILEEFSHLNHIRRRETTDHVSPYKLDDASFGNFRKAASEEFLSNAARFRPEDCVDPHYTSAMDGSDTLSSWDIWISPPHRGLILECHDYLPFYLPLREPPSMYRELSAFRQYLEDYFWSSAPEALHMSVSTDCNISPKARLLFTTEDVLHDAQALNSMPIPVVHEISEDVTDDDYPTCDREPNFKGAPEAIVTALPARDVKILAFNATERYALSSLKFAYDFKNTPFHVMELYLEREVRRKRDLPNATLAEVCRYALDDLVALLAALVTRGALDCALEILSAPLMFSDVQNVSQNQAYRDYKLFDLSTLDDHLLDRYPPELYVRLFEDARSMHPGITREQILVVTTSQYHTHEGAAAAYFPTALPTKPVSSVCELVEGDSTFPLALKRPFCRRIRDIYQIERIFETGTCGTTWIGSNMLTGEAVAIKYEMPRHDQPDAQKLRYEAQVYRVLRGHTGVPTVRWVGVDGDGVDILVHDTLGMTLEQLRCVCRGRLSPKTVSMLALQMLDRVEFAHSRGIILREITPRNLAMGIGELSSVVHFYDGGLARLYLDPSTGQHNTISWRVWLLRHATLCKLQHALQARSSEQSRRDDLEMLGNSLLYLLYGRLPWQRVYAPSLDAKRTRIGEMKAGNVFSDLLEASPPAFMRYFAHSRGLSFEGKPDCALLTDIFETALQEGGWVNDGMFDWVEAGSLQQGTLPPDEYIADEKAFLPKGPT